MHKFVLWFTVTDRRDSRLAKPIMTNFVLPFFLHAVKYEIDPMLGTSTDFNVNQYINHELKNLTNDISCHYVYTVYIQQDVTFYYYQGK